MPCNMVKYDHPMKQFLVTVLFLLLCLAGSAQKRTTVFPFMNLLKDTDTLVVRGGPKITKGAKTDTLYKAGIGQIAGLYFSDKDFDVEKYGVTPGGSIELIRDGKQIALISCWDINDTYYAINISIEGVFVYHGLLIRKIPFDRAFVPKGSR